MLAKGLCADLAESEVDAGEYRRRAREVERLFEAAGMLVAIEGPEHRPIDQASISPPPSLA
jgi:hypothetical protein